MLRQIKKRHCCRSVQWLSFSQETCSQCLRICVQGLTVEGQSGMIDMKELILKGNAVKYLSYIDIQMFYEDALRFNKE